MFFVIQQISSKAVKLYKIRSELIYYSLLKKFSKFELVLFSIEWLVNVTRLLNTYINEKYKKNHKRIFYILQIYFS